MAQHVAALAPEAGDRFPDGGVVSGRVGVDEAGVGDFALGGGVDAVHFGVCEGFEILDGGKGRGWGG